MDNTYKYSSKYTDIIAVLDSILSFVEGCKLYKINEVIDTDHWGYVVNINLIDYFEEEFSNWD